jgi:two-component system chemotaxis response regulator CheV
MVAGLLEQAGFKVTRTLNGKMAWDQLSEWSAAAKEESRPITDFVSVVVTDIEMPAMDGHHLTRRIKEDPFLRHLPVILCSSIITETLRHKGAAVGADDQISKAEVTQHLAERALDLVRKAQAAA